MAVRIFSICALILLTTVFSSIANDSEDLVIQLDNGKIRGHILNSWKGNYYYAFQEIPYAAPPIGTARFQKAREVEPWEGILNTSSSSRICFQLDHYYESLHYTEDCLLLNVYSPLSETFSPNSLWTKWSMLKSMVTIYEKRDITKFNELEAFLKRKSKGYKPKKSAVLSPKDVIKFLKDAPNEIHLLHKKPSSEDKLPVLVWIHGGGLSGQSGAYQYYGPQYIMDYGIVVVTFNYRLGAFGFTTTEDDVIPANIGLKDQRYALKWVKENIHAFGGDPDHITIAGESAGAFSVGLHQLGDWKGEKELFHAVILESGAALGDMRQPNARETAFDLGRQLDKEFSSNDSKDLLMVLQKASPEDILKVNKQYGTVIEKDGPFAHAGLQSFMDGNIKKIPSLIGFNSEEKISVGRKKNIETLRQYDDNPSLLIPTYLHMSSENRSITGALLKKVYTNTSFEEDLGAFVRWTSDTWLVTGALKQVELGSTQSPHYLYQFSYKGDLGGNNFPPIIVPGCGTVEHQEEVRYIWDNSTNSNMNEYPVEDQLVHLKFIKMWTNFIKYYDPTPEDDPLLNITWPKSNTDLVYLNINTTMEVLDNPRQFRQQKAILDSFIQPPFISY